MKPRNILFVAGYLFFLGWMLTDGFKSFENLKESFFLIPIGAEVERSEFPWGSIYLQSRNGNQYGPGEESYHLLSEENAFINFENTATRLNVHYELSDGTQLKRWKFTNFLYNAKKRELRADLDFSGNGVDHLVVYSDYATYEMYGDFWRGRGFQLDQAEYKDVLPISFPMGGKLVFDAYSTKDETEVFFRFENKPYPDNEPSYETQSIQIDTKGGIYEIAIPPLAQDLKFHSVLMYLPKSDSELFIKDMRLFRESDKSGTALKLEFSDAFGKDVYYYQPYIAHDSKWSYIWQFSKDFSKIKSGKLSIIGVDEAPSFELNYSVKEPSWYYFRQ